ncbi:MAG TPA: hypothetical protein V6D08_21705 [Candidatus Obscuribacterales bacterium]
MIYTILVAISPHCSPALSANATSLPDLLLWAWQRPEDLSWISPSEVGVAYLACHLILLGDRVVTQRRQQPLKVPPGSRMIAVVRIDSDSKHKPDLSVSQIEQAAQAIARFSEFPRTVGVQIDFDAAESEREFYASLIRRVRNLLAPEKMLSITALASWCLFDNWIKDLPVDEAVPMMFSLGQDRSKVLLHFKSHRDFSLPLCCRSLGISLEEQDVNALMIPLAQRRKMPVRIYAYSRSAWSPAKLEQFKHLIKSHETKPPRTSH